MEMENKNFESAHVWRPLDVLHDSSHYPLNGLLLLNVSLKKNIRHLHRMWNSSPLRLVLDGAANHLYENLLMPSGGELALPHLISGDFDSIKPDVLNHFKGRNVSVIHTPDQNETDLTKGLRLVSERLTTSSVSSLVVFGYNCGRFDQIIACIQSLFLARAFMPPVEIYLVHASSVSFLLHPGKHEIAIDRRLSDQPCGLIPIGQPAECVSTTGLKWNLSESRLGFGDLVSTSNTYDFSPSSDGRFVTINTDAPLLWTMEIPETEQA